MVSSLAIRHTGAAQPRLWPVHGVVCAAAAGGGGGLRALRKSFRDHSNREARASHGDDRGAEDARCLACGDREGIRGAGPKHLAGEKYRGGKRRKVFAARLAFPPHSSRIRMEILGVHFWWSGAVEENGRVF